MKNIEEFNNEISKINDEIKKLDSRINQYNELKGLKDAIESSCINVGITLFGLLIGFTVAKILTGGMVNVVPAVLKIFASAAALYGVGAYVAANIASFYKSGFSYGSLCIFLNVIKEDYPKDVARKEYLSQMKDSVENKSLILYDDFNKNKKQEESGYLFIDLDIDDIDMYDNGERKATIIDFNDRVRVRKKTRVEEDNNKDE
jgi:hypothetical protein